MTVLRGRRRRSKRRSTSWDVLSTSTLDGTVVHPFSRTEESVGVANPTFCSFRLGGVQPGRARLGVRACCKYTSSRLSVFRDLVLVESGKVEVWHLACPEALQADARTSLPARGENAS